MDLPALIEKGFTQEEAQVLKKWVDEGKPGLTKHRAEQFGSIYALGHSCQDIHRWFPEYPLPILLHARLQFGWDEVRVKYRSIVQEETLAAAVAAKGHSIRFISDLLSATHVKWQRELIRYMANPENEQPPACLPNSLHQYSQLLELMNTSLGINQSRGRDGKPDDGPGASVPLVSVTVQSGPNKPDVVVKSATSDDIKTVLQKGVEARKGKAQPPRGE